MSNAIYKIPIALSGLVNAGKYLVVDDDGYNLVIDPNLRTVGDEFWFGSDSWFDATTHSLYGSDKGGQDIHLYSTSHATKGKIYFGANSVYDELNDRIGIGTVAPTDQITLVNAGGTAGFSIDSGSGVSYQYDWMAMKHAGVMRWSICKTNDASADLIVGRYNDAGTYIDSPIKIYRDTGQVNFSGSLFMANGKNFYIGSDAGSYANTWFNSSLGQWGINRKAGAMNNGLAFLTNGANKWLIGLDATEDDLVLAYSFTLLEDLLRIKETGVTWFGTSVKLGIRKIPTTYPLEIDGDVSLDSGHVYRVNAVQVVGARVMDARCDDAINSGDATTDGVIDALRDAMIAHGLIAAA